MDNPPSTTAPTRRRRALVSGGAALAVAGCVGIATAGASSQDGEPLVLSADHVRDEMALIRTQTAAKAVLFTTGAKVALSSVRQTAAVPSTVPGAAIAALAAPATVPTLAPPATAAPRPTPPTTAAPATTAPPPPPTTAPPAPARTGANPNDPATWDRLAQCESGGNWAINTGNGYYGGLQFSASTWRSVGGTGLPHQHSRETQIEMGKRLQARSGWGQWPACTRKLGYR